MRLGGTDVQGTDRAFAGALLAANGLVLALAYFQAYKARTVPTEYHETTCITVVVMGLLELLLIGLPVIMVLRDSTSPTSLFVVYSVVISIASFMILLPIFIPKLLRKNMGFVKATTVHITGVYSKLSRPFSASFSTLSKSLKNFNFSSTSFHLRVGQSVRHLGGFMSNVRQRFVCKSRNHYRRSSEPGVMKVKRKNAGDGSSAIRNNNTVPRPKLEDSMGRRKRRPKRSHKSPTGDESSADQYDISSNCGGSARDLLTDVNDIFKNANLHHVGSLERQTSDPLTVGIPESSPFEFPIKAIDGETEETVIVFQPCSKESQDEEEGLFCPCSDSCQLKTVLSHESSNIQPEPKNKRRSVRFAEDA
jgi:hypothetical protein